MTHGIPADVRIFDLTGDGFADRMYAGDMGGRVWRFDIHNGQTRANLVTGGVFASLGNAHLATHPIETTRRFYSAPDAAFLSAGGRSWLNIALGSGYRGHPLNTQVQDRFYSLRDYQPFARLTQAQYDAATVITEADVNLIDITTDIAPTIPPGCDRLASRPASPECRLDRRKVALRGADDPEHDPVHDLRAEQRLDAGQRSCTPGFGTNRLYTISAYTGAPVYDRESPEDPPDSVDDRDTSSRRAASRRKWCGSSRARKTRRPASARSAAPTRCASSASKTAASASTSRRFAPSGGRPESTDEQHAPAARRHA